MVEEIFETVFCYYPISFKPPSNDPFGIKPELLSSELESVIAAAFLIIPNLVLEALTERLENSDNISTIIPTISKLFSNVNLISNSDRALINSDGDYKDGGDRISTLNSSNLIDQVGPFQEETTICRLVEFLVSNLKFPKNNTTGMIIQLFKSDPFLKNAAKKYLKQLSNSIFIENQPEESLFDLFSDSLISALFELDAIGDEIWTNLIIDPFSPKTLLFLRNIQPTRIRTVDFCVKLEKKIEFNGNLLELPFLLASITALKKLNYEIPSREKIFKIQKDSLAVLVNQTCVSISIFNTLLETGLLLELAPTLHTAYITIQGLDPSNDNIKVSPTCVSANSPTNDSNDIVRRDGTSCVLSSTSNLTSTLIEKDTCEWLKTLSKMNDNCCSMPNDELILKASKNSCVWVRLASIKRAKNKNLISSLLSDQKRVVRRLASLYMIEDLNPPSTSGSCCRS